MKRGWSTLRLVVRVVEDWGENEMLLDEYVGLRWEEFWKTQGGVWSTLGRCVASVD